MSHFTNIKTQLRNLTSLKSALNDLDVDWKEGSATVRGYQGNSHTAQLVVEQKNNYDIGFSWNGEEYELVADLQYWQQPLSVDGFLQRITQRYAYHTVVNESSNKGFQVAQEEKNQDGSIRLVLQRWNG